MFRRNHAAHAAPSLLAALVALLLASACNGEGAPQSGASPDAVIALLTIASFEPISAAVDGGGTLTLRANPTGQAFNADVSKIDVKFGGVQAINVKRVDDFTLEVEIPPHAAGAVQVVVRQPSSNDQTLSFTYAYRLTPGTGYIAGGTVTTLSRTLCSGFVTSCIERSLSDVIQVLFDRVPATQLTAASGSLNRDQLTVVAPPHAAGYVDVELVFSGLTGVTRVTLPQAFRYLAALEGGPRLVSAISLSNTSLRVTFSEPVAESANDPTNYFISKVEEHDRTQSQALQVTAARPARPRGVRDRVKPK